ncbi:hypothetical protein EDB85DRAFT_1894205 [Lactarius pseudohatsudake]|nr:hypothetical protein EDB85DRAFT_1894205 [Lactarius pseudohatsudake]
MAFGLFSQSVRLSVTVSLWECSLSTLPGLVITAPLWLRAASVSSRETHRLIGPTSTILPSPDTADRHPVYGCLRQISRLLQCVVDHAHPDGWLSGWISGRKVASAVRYRHQIGVVNSRCLVMAGHTITTSRASSRVYCQRSGVSCDSQLSVTVVHARFVVPTPVVDDCAMRTNYARTMGPSRESA